MVEIILLIIWLAITLAVEEKKYGLLIFIALFFIIAFLATD